MAVFGMDIRAVDIRAFRKVELNIGKRSAAEIGCMIERWLPHWNGMVGMCLLYGNAN